MAADSGSHLGAAMSTPYYADDAVTLYLGDALLTMSALDAGSFDAVLTDPPFSSGGRRENARSLRKSMTRVTEDSDWIMGDAMSTPGFGYLMRECGIMWRRLLVDGGHALAFIDWRMWGTMAAALETADLRQHPLLVWDKGRLGMGAVFRNQHELIVHMSKGNPNPPQRRDVANVLRFPPTANENHPTEKPTTLLSRLASVVVPPGGNVLDCFAGSGSTLVAVKALGMRGIGIEGDERYCEIAARRLSQGVLDFGGAA